MDMVMEEVALRKYHVLLLANQICHIFAENLLFLNAINGMGFYHTPPS
jgi:hypothetical protein